MKKFITLLLASFSLFLSCTPTNDPNSPQRIPLATIEVITSSGTWVGEWFNAKGERIGTAGPNGEPTFMPSGWKLSFRPQKLPFELFCNAEAATGLVGSPASPDVTVNLYVDGIRVASETNKYAKGVTTADYIIQP